MDPVQHPDDGRTYVFRPRASRIAAYAVGGLVLAGAVVLSVIAAPTLTDKSGFIVVGLIIFVFCHLEASVRVTARQDALVVRNLGRSRTLEWAEVVGVVFPPGDPWAKLDLSNGDTLAVMAVQRTDGKRGMRDARTLAGLVETRGGVQGL
jgi:hypothetical protein